MYIINLSCIIYRYCKLILKSASGKINKKVLYCIVSLLIGTIQYTILTNKEWHYKTKIGKIQLVYKILELLITKSEE